MADLPSGTVTFLFTDVEGSTRLLHELGAEAYAEALAEHRRIVREACWADGGVEVDTQGDAFFFAFPTAPGALAAAQKATEALAGGSIRVRIGLHTGTPLLTKEGYVGADVHFAARVAAAAHGGQVVFSQATRDLLDGHALTDLGEHRLKDIEGPVSIFQLGEEQFPPLKTISNTNLPRPASSFIGRERELEEVLARVGEGARLVTLTGPGGSGKTRLALEAATSLVPEYKAGVFWVGLAALRDPALVSETISQTLGAKDGLPEHIGEREMLLLLDNLEQVIEAAPELSSLLSACPNLTLFVTSRELLRLQGEVEYPVPPLQEPEAVTLFCERAQAEPSDEIAQLCARLDNLPLAVELAAARIKALSPAQILERLSQRLDLLRGGRDADPRQQTLRTTIEWSYQLLSDKEQRLFARLSVFAGGCSLEAAEEVAEADLDTLQSLVEKSLLRFTNERYWMLETIREYAGERLAADGEGDDVRGRAADHFLALAQSLPRDAPVSREWLHRLDVEHDNLRAVLDSLVAAGATQLVLRLAGALWRFWNVRGYHSEGMGRLEQALAGDDTATAARAYALVGAVALAVDIGDYERGRCYAEEALALYRDLEDAWGIARGAFELGYVAIESGHVTRARPFLEDSLERFSGLAAEHDVMLVLFNLSWACDELGDRERGRELAEEYLRRARASGSARNMAFGLDLLSGYAREDDRLDEAFDAVLEGLRIRRDEGDIQHQLDGLSRMAALHARADQLEIAARLLSSSLYQHEERRMNVPLFQEKRNQETLARMRAGLDQQRLATAWDEGRTMSLDEAVEYALGSID